MVLEWSKLVTDRILHSTAHSCIKGLKSPYETIGYKNLGLLNQTDVKWLVEAFGEPEAHRTAREVNPELWQRAVELFRQAEGKDEKHFWRSHGFNGPPEVEKQSTSTLLTSSAQRSPQGRGCLVVVLGIFFAALLVIALGGYGW
jgi:hypothetical protein